MGFYEKTVTLEIYELHWRWWWESINGDYEDRYQAQNTKNRICIRGVK